MIKKITEIKNIGKFENYKSSDISFGQFNGIYSDNGQGKSTLTNILRSYSERNPKIIVGRKTIASTGPIICKIESANGFKTFKDQEWDSSDSNLLIFDAQFVSQNIYSGMYVGIDHRRKLYQFIIGETAIHLNEKVNSIAQSISKLNTKINEKKSELNKTLGKDISVEDFIKLEEVENVQEVIAAKAKEVNALSDKDKILKKPKFSKIELPDFSPQDMATLLSKTLQDIAKDSENKVKEHIESHLDGNGETWLKQGVSYKRESDQCPFCGLDISSNELISAYSDYFNDTYNAFKDKIETHKSTFQKGFNETLSGNIKKVLSDNINLLDFWSGYVSVGLVAEDVDRPDCFHATAERDVDSFQRQFIQDLGDLLDEKFKSPLDAMGDDSRYKKIEAAYNDFRTKVDIYNNLVDRQNSIIQHHKDGLGTSDVETEKGSLRRLKLARARYSDDVKPICDEYQKLVDERQQLVDEKEAVRRQLDNETKKIPEKYQEKINYYLERFGADFKIIDHKKINPSGQAATEYKLMLKGVEIILGDNKTPEDVVSFQNTLSEGDKSTLAFSYFLARLDADNNLSEKILVFDDPISSLDRFRRTWTRNILRKFGQQAKQLIVLSHDPGFLEEMAHSLRGTDFKCLEISWDPERNSSVLSVTTPNELNKNDHIRNLEKVKNYLKARTGNPEDVQARLRHLCEHHLRRKYPQSFFRKDNLGRMIQKIRESDADDEIAAEKEGLTDLETINDYSIEENHSQDGDSGRIDEVELTSNCKLTFNFIEEPIPE